jgi:hypothetical protein
MEFADDFRNSSRAASQYRLLMPNKKPQPRLGLIEVCVEKWRRKGPELCEESGPDWL